MENLFTKENALRIIDSVNGKRIDIRKTIEKTQSASDFGLMHLYCVPLDARDLTTRTFPELMGMEFTDYKDNVDEAYYKRVMDHLEEGNGIYITLAYVCEASPSKDDEIYEFFAFGRREDRGSDRKDVYGAEDRSDDLSGDDHAGYPGL